MWRTGCLVSMGLVLFGMTCVSRVAWAESRVKLAYFQSPGVEGCAGERELEQAVSQRLGENPFDPLAARTLKVDILAHEGALSGVVTILDEHGIPEGLRRFDGKAGSCPELVAALALAVSLAINPDLVVADGNGVSSVEPLPPASPSGSPLPRTAAAGPVVPATADQSDPSAAAAKARRDPAAWTLALGLGGHFAMGTGPEPAGGATLLGRARRGAVSLGLEGRFDAAAEHSVSGDDVVYARLLGGAIVPCVHYGPVLGCAVGLFADMSAGSDGVTVEQTDHGLFVAAGLRGGFLVPLEGPVSLEGRFDALFAVKPVNIVLNADQVWESPVVSGALGMAVVVQIL